MPVANKYRPVDPTPSSLTAPGAVLAGAWALAILVSLASPSTLRAEATYGGWPDPVAQTLRLVADVADRTPFAALRTSLDALAAPLEHTTRFARAVDTTEPPSGGGASIPEATAPEPSDARTPKERWTVSQPPPVRRVLLVGASSIQYAVGTELERLMSDSLDVQVRRKGKVSTGLTRPDVFDWPEEVRRQVAEFRPDLVLGQFAGNDGQNIVDDAGAAHPVYSDAWAAEYAKRIAGLQEIVTEGGARLALMGMPIMRSEKFSKKIRWMNDITRDAIEAAGGTYIETYHLAADDRGAYRPDVVVDGSSGRMRMDDGIHFTRLGGKHMARALLPELLVRFPFSWASPEPPDSDAPAPARDATLYPLRISPGLGLPAAELLAYVPEDPPDEGLPLVVLLHGAWDGPRGFPQRLLRELAELARQERVVLAMPDGGPHGWWLDATEHPAHRRATWLTRHVLPWILDHLPVDPEAPRAIVGLSMGGHGALLSALDHPGLWHAVGSLSGVVDLRRSVDRDNLVALLGPPDDAPGAWASRSALARLQQQPHALGDTRLYLGVGEGERYHADNLALHELLEEAGTTHTWAPRTGTHDWDLWTRTLPALLRWAAQPPSPAPPPEDPPP